ncbi:MAG: plasmid pRiA4b ORF-3 family protein [Bacteroidales bacterium]|nr:plasmid pRiA4b ORF-3 family protein [Bacteroidales bacterium]
MEENEDDDLNHSIFDDIIGDDIFENADQYSEEIIKNLLKVKSRGFQFKIQIENISHPPVWRKVIVPSHYSFTFFHFIIQDVFGWSHFHMYQFSPKGWGSYPIIKQISEDDFETGEALESTDTMLSDIFKKEGEKFTYIYDFGDDWKHTITLEKILSEEINQPVCIDGKGQCPPEDCGGSPGFENMKAILADSSHPEYEETKEWLDLGDDEIWNPNEFNLQEVQENLNSFFTLNSELKLN